MNNIQYDINTQAVAMLEAERQKYADLFNQSPLPQWVYDVESLKFLAVNEAAILHYGYTRAEFIKMSIREIRSPEEVSQLDEILRKEVMVGIQHKSNVRHQKKNGEIISVCAQGNSVFFEGRNARIVILIDRSAEIKADKDLQESVQRYNIVSKATSDAIWDLNVITGTIIWSRGIKGIFGHSGSRYNQKWWEQHVHPQDISKVLDKIALMIKNKKSRIKLEYRFRCGDGSYRFVLDRAFIVYDPEGMPIRLIGSMQDITDRVNGIREIKNQNKQLREISWLQSHKIRSPLAKILGLVSLINLSKTDVQALDELLPLLTLSAEELDAVLKDIVNKTI